MAGAAEGGDYVPGKMDVQDHQETFSGFLKVAEWGTVLIVGWVALLTVAFAIGAGWFPGVLAYLAISVAAGLLLKMGPAWWVVTAASVVLMGVGGGIVALVLSMTAPAKAAALLAAVFA